MHMSVHMSVHMSIRMSVMSMRASIHKSKNAPVPWLCLWHMFDGSSSGTCLQEAADDRRTEAEPQPEVEQIRCGCLDLACHLSSESLIMRLPGKRCATPWSRHAAARSGMQIVWTCSMPCSIAWQPAIQHRHATLPSNIVTQHWPLRF